MANRAERDVEQFMLDFHPDGVTPLQRRVSFPKRPEAVKLLSAMVFLTYSIIEQRRAIVLENEANRVAIVGKIAAFLTRFPHERPIADALVDIGRAAVMIADNPALATDRIGIPGMVRLHKVQEDRARRLALPHPDNVPPRLVHWSLPGRSYVLSELTHPWHVADEGQLMDHCMAIMDDPSQHLDPLRLRYWRYIQNRQSRIFSIQDQSGPRCTIHIALQPQCIIELQSYPSEDLYQAVPTPVFAACMQHLKSMMPNLTAYRSLAPEVITGISSAFAAVGAALVLVDDQFRPDQDYAFAVSITEVASIIASISGNDSRPRSAVAELARLLSQSISEAQRAP